MSGSLPPAQPHTPIDTSPYRLDVMGQPGSKMAVSASHSLLPVSDAKSSLDPSGETPKSRLLREANNGIDAALNPANEELEHDAETQDPASAFSSIAGLSIATVGEEISECVQQRILVHFPWIKTEAIMEIAERCGTVIKNDIAEQFPIVQATHSRISFMSLSLELREMVYDLVLISDETDENRFDPRNPPVSDKYCHNLYKRSVICLQQCEIKVYKHTDYYGWKSEWAQQPAITRVSREIRSEALPTFYKKNEFVAFLHYEGPWTGSLDRVKSFLSSIGPHNAQHIQHLSLLFPDADEHGDIIGEEVREELAGESMGLARAAVQLFEGGNFASNPVNPHGFVTFGWGYQGEELESDPDWLSQQESYHE